VPQASVRQVPHGPEGDLEQHHRDGHTDQPVNKVFDGRYTPGEAIDVESRQRERNHAPFEAAQATHVAVVGVHLAHNNSSS
jgi:hypothetical protein